MITVFGCGGDRDRSKRPLMGEAAGKGSDFVVLTSDNPRSEDPLAIINDAVVGLQRSGAKYTTEPDRRAGIHLALSEARAGDIVLIAGKGHEQVQITKSRDRSVRRQAGGGGSVAVIWDTTARRRKVRRPHEAATGANCGIPSGHGRV